MQKLLQMKKLFYTTILAVMITACGKDSPDGIDAGIIGAWELNCYYIDYDNNPTNFNNIERYEKHNNAKNTITFLSQSECGFIMDYPCVYIVVSYHTEKGKINITGNQACEQRNKVCDIFEYDYYVLGENITYKKTQNKLILASEVLLNTSYVKQYGVYNLK